MTNPLTCTWSGVFPAATTQFDADLQVDLPATQKVQKALLDDGVHGLVLMGTVGEGINPVLVKAAENATAVFVAGSRSVRV